MISFDRWETKPGLGIGMSFHWSLINTHLQCCICIYQFMPWFYIIHSSVTTSSIYPPR